jgi:hypothetical protein
MYAALRAKEEIVHPASIGHPSASSAQLTQYAGCCRLSSISFLHKFSFVRRGVGGGYYRHGAHQPPLRSAHRPALAGALMLSFAALGNIIA